MEPNTYLTVIKHTPDILSSEIPLDAIITVEFSRDINPRSVNTQTFIVIEGSNIVSGDFNVNKKIVTFIPKQNLKPGTKYQVILVGAYNATLETQSIMDITGLPLENNYTFSFITTNIAILEAPVITNPAHQSIISDLTIRWTAVDGAVNYSIDVCDDKLFENVIYASTVVGTSVKIDSLELNKEYFVRVKANSEMNTSDWSEVHSFYYELASNDNSLDISSYNTEVKLIKPATLAEVSPDLNEIIFEVNKSVTLADIEASLEGSSIHGIPYLESDGVKNGSLEILEQGEGYTRIRYVM